MYERIFYLLLAETRDVSYAQTYFMFEEENAQHLQISLILNFFQALFLQLPFFVFCKMGASTAHPCFYQIGISFHLISQKPGMFTPPILPGLHKRCTLWRGILKFCAPLLYPRIMTQVNLSWTLYSRWVVWLWSYVIDSELLSKPTSISITHLLKR